MIPFSFNSTDDDLFADLLDQHAINSRNSLASIVPSSLNFTANCWTTQDLYSVAYNSSSQDETTLLQHIGNALQPSLPLTGSALSLISINEYWEALYELPTTLTVLQGAVHRCHAMQAFNMPPLNFTSNCSATAQLWAGLVSSSTNDLSLIWLHFLRSSLVQPLSDVTIQKIIQTLPLLNGNQSTDAFPLVLQQRFNASAAQCAQSACQALGYSGSEVSGLGAIVSYGCIAGVSTLAAILVIYFALKRKGMNPIIRNPIIESMVIFWDTLTWFSIFAWIAFLALIFNGTTLFDFVISFLVGLLILNALSILTFCAFAVKAIDHSVLDRARLFPQLLPTVIGSSFGTAFLFIVSANRSMDHYFQYTSLQNVQDLPCYASGLWPLDFLRPALYMQVASNVPVIVIPGLYKAAINLARVFRLAWLAEIITSAERWTRSRLWWIIIVLPFFMLCADFCLILYVRSRAAAQFGPSFSETTLGYGQIISIGLPAQFIWVFCYRVTVNKLGSKKPSKELLQETEQNLQQMIHKQSPKKAREEMSNPIIQGVDLPTAALLYHKHLRDL